MARRNGPTFAEIKAVLSAPQQGLPERTDVDQAALELVTARAAFLARATPATWTRLVAAARRVNAEVKRGRADG
jgi:hypothetical protein